LVTAFALAAEMTAREAAASTAAALAAARAEQQVVAADDALLALVSLALSEVATTDERCVRLAEVLRAERGIDAEISLRAERPLELAASGPPPPEPVGGVIVRPLVVRGRLLGELR